MAIQIRQDGTVVADTAEEAVAYQLAMAKANRGGATDVMTQKPARSGWGGLCHSLEGSDPKKAIQRKLLSLVKSAKTIDIANLSKSLGANAQTVGGHVSGLRKRALTASLGADDLIIKVGTTITAGPALLANDLPASWR